MYFLGGIQLLGIGILGEYTSKIYMETKRAPGFVGGKYKPLTELDIQNAHHFLLYSPDSTFRYWRHAPHRQKPNQPNAATNSRPATTAIRGAHRAR